MSHSSRWLRNGTFHDATPEVAASSCPPTNCPRALAVTVVQKQCGREQDCPFTSIIHNNPIGL